MEEISLLQNLLNLKEFTKKISGCLPWLYRCGMATISIQKSLEIENRTGWGSFETEPG
ncbi:MAG: hypothetical protein MUW56_17475 [Chryseobacterium sp.]|uniref:hypothetical protein n=1 Tax=Chryseobacterium sp. TaxID=1871047 RepID=UPI0025B8936C|nr:hypothetical protein [Chryseobacterium sp.]MCJ7935362.1 hypothetical protein [Chryseobacterium sp.]